MAAPTDSPLSMAGVSPPTLTFDCSSPVLVNWLTVGEELPTIQPRQTDVEQVDLLCLQYQFGARLPELFALLQVCNRQSRSRGERSHV